MEDNEFEKQPQDRKKASSDYFMFECWDCSIDGNRLSSLEDLTNGEWEGLSRDQDWPIMDAQKIKPTAKNGLNQKLSGLDFFLSHSFEDTALSMGTFMFRDLLRNIFACWKCSEIFLVTVVSGTGYFLVGEYRVTVQSLGEWEELWSHCSLDSALIEDERNDFIWLGSSPPMREQNARHVLLSSQ